MHTPAHTRPALHPCRSNQVQVKGSIKVLNNGAGIPVEVHKTEVSCVAVRGQGEEGRS